MNSNATNNTNKEKRDVIKSQKGAIAGILLILIIDRLFKFSVQHFWWTGDFVFGNIFIGASYHLRFNSHVVVVAMIIVWFALMWVTIRSFRQNRIFCRALFIILLGAASNCWDMLFSGSIINVITLTAITGSLSFNIADLMVVGGVIFIILKSMRPVSFRPRSSGIPLP